jgi:hypothetical protein
MLTVSGTGFEPVRSLRASGFQNRRSVQTELATDCEHEIETTNERTTAFHPKRTIAQRLSIRVVEERMERMERIKVILVMTLYQFHNQNSGGDPGNRTLVDKILARHLRDPSLSPYVYDPGSSSRAATKRSIGRFHQVVSPEFHRRLSPVCPGTELISTFVFILNAGASERIRTSTPLRAIGPQPIASTNFATDAFVLSFPLLNVGV